VRLFVPPQRIASLAFAGISDEQTKHLDEGRVVAVPQGAVIDTGDQKIVYRQSSPGVFDGVRVTLGPKMVDPNGVTFLPVLGGLAIGDQIVTSGSFLVDAETRLNPAAGSIYLAAAAEKAPRPARSALPRRKTRMPKSRQHWRRFHPPIGRWPRPSGHARFCPRAASARWARRSS